MTTHLALDREWLDRAFQVSGDSTKEAQDVKAAGLRVTFPRRETR